MPRVLLLYHFYEPDSVISAVHYSQLARGLEAAGWSVEVWPSNRCRTVPRLALAGRERIDRVVVRRCWRPWSKQSSGIGRLVNTAFMWIHWIGRAFAAKDVDVVILGTDPPLSAFVARAWQVIRPRARIMHWSFDLYPDAAVADGLMRRGALIDRVLRSVAIAGLAACRSVVDIGPCMRARIAGMVPSARSETIAPWAIVESAAHRRPDPALRRELFGEAKTVLLYAGSLGRAHEFSCFLHLARALRDDGVIIAFQRIGQREAEVRKAAAELDNVRFLPPTSEPGLARRLECADFHLVSLKEGWEGTVVPSKFFSALAVGRPVIFAGPVLSSVAQWIHELDVGIVLPCSMAPEVVVRVVREAIARARTDSEGLSRRLEIAHSRFSRQAGLASWVRLLESDGVRG